MDAIAKIDTQGDDLIERLATKGVAVEVLRELLELRAVEKARMAREMFYAELSAAQKEMRPVSADASNPQTRSKYASYAALDNAVRPIYTRHGFALSFDTADATLPENVRVICNVSHAAGHEHLYHVDMPADGKGAKGGDVMTKTHAVGAGISYGMRYLLKMVFNIAVGEDDRDGNAPALHVQLDKPEGYDAWFAALSGVADEGKAALDRAWTGSRGVYKNYINSVERPLWDDIKRRAAQVKK